MRQSRNRNSWIALGLICCLGFGPLAAEEEKDAEPAPGSFLKGRVLAADGKAPLSGVRVMLYHLSSELALTAEPTGGKGNFEIPALPYGYFDLAVATDDGLFVANQVINVPPSGKSVVVLTLRRFAETTPSGERRPFPGTDEAPVGVALLAEKLVGAAFWGSPKGLTVLGVAGGGALLLLAGGGSSGTVSDPMP